MERPQTAWDARTAAELNRIVNQLIREWAAKNDVKLPESGKILNTVRAQWIRAHQGRHNEVIGHSLFRNSQGPPEWRRVVTVLCYRCASTHTHVAGVAERGRWQRPGRCLEPYAGQGDYFIEDNLPMDDNEQLMAESNKQHQLSVSR